MSHYICVIHGQTPNYGCRVCVEEAAHQAQYELMRAGRCSQYNYRLGCLFERWPVEDAEPNVVPCPTDYRECPLTKDGEK